MQGSRRLSTVGAVLVAISTATLMSFATASAATTTTRWVDRDGHAGPRGCNGSAGAATSIQGAVTASDDDDIVIVCPGTYREQVVIRGNRDGLTLRSWTPFGAIIKTPSSLDRPLGFSFLVLIDHVDRVTVRGFKTITRTHGPCDNVDATIIGLGSRHTAIRGNRILAPGARSSSACFQGYGILLLDAVGPDSTARASSGVIGFNEVRDTVFMGVGGFAGSTRLDIDVVHNSVRAYFGQPPVGGSPVGGITVGGQFAVGLLGRVRGSVRNNVIQGAGAAPIGGATFLAGIFVSPVYVTASGPGSNGHIEVRGNTVRRVLYGLFAVGADQLGVRNNRFTNTYAGILLQQVEDTSIKHNRIGARNIGIAVDSTSTGNQLRHNKVTGAGGTCQDASSGSGTAGTDNTWTRNTASHGGSPAGICATH